jgi:hypothetical protein
MGEGITLVFVDCATYTPQNIKFGLFCRHMKLCPIGDMSSIQIFLTTGCLVMNATIVSDCCIDKKFVPRPKNCGNSLLYIQ